VIIPTHNRVALLGETLRSVLAQTRAADEIIVVDDGSTDDTRRLVEILGATVRYHFQENSGLATARSQGMALSNGDAVCFLDSDDLLLPGALATLERALVANPNAVLAYCRSQTIDKNGKLIEALWWKEDHYGDVWKHLIDGNFIRSPGCALIRGRALKQIESWDARLLRVEDWDLWVRLAEEAPFVRVEEALFQYRVHGQNMSRDVFRMHCQTLRLLRKHRRRNRNNPERLAYIRAAQVRARAVVANECFVRAREAQNRGDDLRALRHFLRALRLRPRYLRERPFVIGLLGTGRALCGGRSYRRTPATTASRPE
jgi:glycosyltransferase involved in cell wall biosynthesis